MTAPPTRQPRDAAAPVAVYGYGEAAEFPACPIEMIGRLVVQTETRHFLNPEVERTAVEEFKKAAREMGGDGIIFARHGPAVEAHVPDDSPQMPETADPERPDSDAGPAAASRPRYDRTKVEVGFVEINATVFCFTDTSCTN